MDCQMPELDGYETTRRLRQDPRWAQLPVIAMTANAMVGDRDKALAAGMNDHVSKPIRQSLLFGTLARWIVPASAAHTAPAGFDGAALLESGVEPGSAFHGRLLAMFVERSSQFGARFAAAGGDRVTSTRLAHDLKAEAALLGARALSIAAGELEAACAEGAPDGDIQARLDRVQAALVPVLQALRASGSVAAHRLAASAPLAS
jgi:CheY-like chemotaxis protein